MSIDTLLNRLQKVKSTSRNRWMCSCPAHDDKSPSMHIQLTDDNRILINCKAGCDTYSILQSIGLDWADIMPDRAISHQERPIKQILYASEALKLIQFEARIIMMAGYDLAKNKPLTESDMLRAQTAMQRINKAIEATA